MALNNIDTFIIVILENRSFDHMLGYLSLAAAAPSMPVEGLRDDSVWIEKYANSYQGKGYRLHPLGPDIQKMDDPPHEKDTIALQINTPPQAGSGALMGGFVESYMKRNPAPADRLGSRRPSTERRSSDRASVERSLRPPCAACPRIRHRPVRAAATTRVARRTPKPARRAPSPRAMLLAYEGGCRLPRC